MYNTQEDIAISKFIISHIRDVIKTDLKYYSSYNVCCTNTSWLGYYKVLYFNNIEAIYISPNFFPFIHVTYLDGTKGTMSRNEWSRYVKKLYKFRSNNKSITRRILKYNKFNLDYNSISIN